MMEIIVAPLEDELEVLERSKKRYQAAVEESRFLLEREMILTTLDRTNQKILYLRRKMKES